VVKRKAYKVVIKSLHNKEDNPYKQFSPQERIAMVWPLTVEVWSMTKGFDAKDRLLKHITKFYKK
jgi:hypothetical protein